MIGRRGSEERERGEQGGERNDREGRPQGGMQRGLEIKTADSRVYHTLVMFVAIHVIGSDEQVNSYSN